MRSNKYVISAIFCALAVTLAACGEEGSRNEPVPSGTIALTQTTAEETEETVPETAAVSESETSRSETTVVETEAAEDTTTVTEAKTVSPETAAASLTTTDAPETTVTVTETTEADFSAEPVSSFIINGVCYSAADNISINDLGSQSAPVSEYPSCMGDGVDCSYSFSGFTITMYRSPDGDESFVSLTVTDSSVMNPKGLDVGISEEEALAILGDYYAEENGTGVSFIAENGVVTEVDYIKLM
ncbi:MAG: hypothetical protein PUK49_04530 [Oscillospiraceae bacterium]|nr:hypothetical protein [Oscillospiraceae bacterium]